jgi:hypothetical protein
MALKLRLVEGDVLHAHRRFTGDDVTHLVHQQEGIAMWNDPLNQLKICNFGALLGHLCSFGR